MRTYVTYCDTFQWWSNLICIQRRKLKMYHVRVQLPLCNIISGGSYSTFCLFFSFYFFVTTRYGLGLVASLHRLLWNAMYFSDFVNTHIGISTLDSRDSTLDILIYYVMNKIWFWCKYHVISCLTIDQTHIKIDCRRAKQRQRALCAGIA